MNSNSGPPKGYSVPRHKGKGEQRCQYCSSTDHWSYACDKKEKSKQKAAGSFSKLSHTQMLKYGIKRKLTEFVPQPTEREAYEAELKSLERMIGDELRQKKKATEGKNVDKSKKIKPDPTEAKKEDQDQTP
ncbi:unnamed protein product [Phytomonas sp. Hart1]|nr:unnamed protein product [Phytomonas sp. Hart1]|eukprot:CCW67148.1 unnamed protein product [Phytomonas sp. isolate Hart1]